MTERIVLIVGAGPTGLALALWLTELGVKVRIIDKAAEPGKTTRAVAVHWQRRRPPPGPRALQNQTLRRVFESMTSTAV